MTTSVVSPQFNLRAELRLALLAAMESCWLYAIVLTIGTLASFPRQVSPFGIFMVYMAGLLVGRFLPRSQQVWRVLQLLTVAFAFLAIVVAMRVGFYTDAPVYDFHWLPTYLARVLTFFERVTAETISTIILLITFVRALRFAQRPLTLWVIGFQFRLGIVFFFATALVAALSVSVDFIFWIFAYFAFSLIGISLARIEEAGREQPLGGKWALVMLTTIAATMLLGFAATQFLTLDAVDAFFAFISPVTFVIQILVALISIPFFYIFEWLIQLIAPLFQKLFQLITNIFPNLNFQNAEAQRVVTEVTRQLLDLMPYFRLLGVIAVILLIGWWVARALNRRVKWQEHEMFERETLDRGDEILFEKRKRPSGVRAPRREIHAENIRRIYAALLAHAEMLGLKRREAETPLEFLPRLTARFPESTNALQQITDAYVAVHYAQRNATEQQVRDVRALWQRTRARMKDKR